jgi:hypothetical protein
VLDVRDVYLSAGAGFMVVLSGDIMTMPGLPKVPASDNIDIDSSNLRTPTSVRGSSRGQFTNLIRRDVSDRPPAMRQAPAIALFFAAA